MDLLALRYFRAVARHQHVGRAAEELGVAQPSVSRSVIRLEAELGAPLFDRVGRGIRLNRHGRRFLAHVDRGLVSIDDGVRELDDALSADLGEVVVAAETLLPLARLAAGYRERHPRARLSLRQASAPRMSELLGEGAVDLCVTSQPLDVPDAAHVTALSEERVLLVAPDSHPLAGRDPLDLADLAGTAFVLPGEGYWQRTLYDVLVAGLLPSPVVVCETSEPGATLELVRAGLGVTLLPDVARRRTDATGVTWRSLTDPRARRRLALVRPGGYRSRAARAFETLAREYWREAVTGEAQRKE